jgi:AraC-like DNA-binding protein
MMNGPATFRLSTAEFPERDQAAVWRDLYGRKVLRLNAEFDPEIQLRADLTVNLLPGLGMISGSITPCRLTRTRELIADGVDSLFLQIPDGPVRMFQRGREAVLGAGEAALIDSGEPGGIEFGGSDVLALNLPRPALGPLLRNPDGVLIRPVPRSNEALRLLVRYVTAASQAPAISSSELRRAFVDHVYDLVALVLGATREAAELAGGRGLAAARLRAIKDDVLANLHDGALTIAAVAARQRVTPRYIQLLFEAEGTTFSDFVRDQRLARAHRMLSSVRHAGAPISSIAYEVGFGDLSTFNHAFRRAYGMTPSDLRAAARKRG